LPANLTGAGQSKTAGIAAGGFKVELQFSSVDRFDPQFFDLVLQQKLSPLEFGEFQAVATGVYSF
jgi:hypothetical protein